MSKQNVIAGRLESRLQKVENGERFPVVVIATKNDPHTGAYMLDTIQQMDERATAPMAPLPLTMAQLTKDQIYQLAELPIVHSITESKRAYLIP